MHSLVVSYLVPKHTAIHALLHDAAEIYTGDVPSPLKSFLISEFEDSALRSIYKQLGVPFPSLEARRIVKEADVRSCTAEVWTVGPESLKALPEFQTRDLPAENVILEMLDDYDFGSVLYMDGKYVSMFLKLFSSLRDGLSP
jgi:5'-deoxynucleotidase YfbR-like HD superfamily hydrolase